MTTSPLQRRDIHECHEIGYQPPDPYETWRYVCPVCGSSWEWTPSSGYYENLVRVERYGFLGLRTRSVELTVSPGWWLCTNRTHRWVAEGSGPVAGRWTS